MTKIIPNEIDKQIILSLFSNYFMFFASNLKILMQRYKISSIRLSEMLGITDGAIWSYTKGGTFPKMNVIFKIKDIFRIDLEALFFTDLSINLIEIQGKTIIEIDSQKQLGQFVSEPKAEYKNFPEKEESFYRELINGRDREIELLRERIKFLESQLLK